MSDPHTPPPRLAEGLAEYRAGRYWNAHESWERVWRGLDGDDRLCVQALIMLAAAAWHAERQRWRPARRLLLRASQLLEGQDVAARLELPSDLADRARAAAELPHPATPPVSLR